MTMEEIVLLMSEAEAEIKVSQTLTNEEANAQIRHRMPWLS
jgi:hypothetical protein